MPITPSSLTIYGDETIQLTVESTAVWTTNCGSFYTNAECTLKYDGASSVSAVYFKPFNRSISGVVNAGADSAAVEIIGVLPLEPSYDMEWDTTKRGVVASISRAGRVTGQIQGEGEAMRDYKLIYRGRRTWEVEEFEAFYNFHYPHKTFIYRNLWNNKNGLYRFDSSVKPVANARVTGNFEVAVAQVPFDLTTISSGEIGGDTTAPDVPQNFNASNPTPTLIELSWTAASDNIGVTGYELERDSVVVNIGNLTSYSHTVLAGSTHTYRVRSYDAAGNKSDWSVIRKLTSKNADTTAPTVAITKPVHGNGYSPNVTLEVTVLDDIEIAGVQWKIDGANIGSEITDAPYSSSYYAGAYDTGYHSITAVVRDTSGNTASQTVNIFSTGIPDEQNPSVSLSPFQNPEYGGNIILTAYASDNLGIDNVQFYFNDSSGGSTQYIGTVFAPTNPLENPFQIVWDSTNAVNGDVTLQAIAFDTSGNQSNTDFQNIKINNPA